MLKIPVFLSANPQKATRSSIIRIPEGEWRVESSDIVDTKLGVIISDSPLDLLDSESHQAVELPIDLTGPKYIVAWVLSIGMEPHFSVFATKQKAA